MKSYLLSLLLLITISTVSMAQNTAQNNKATISPLREDSTTLYKIIPAELPRPIVDSLLQRNYQLGDVYTAHRNGASSMYVVEIAHELVRETFWFDPKGKMLRPSAKKI